MKCSCGGEMLHTGNITEVDGCEWQYYECACGATRELLPMETGKTPEGVLIEYSIRIDTAPDGKIEMSEYSREIVL